MPTIWVDDTAEGILEDRKRSDEESYSDAIKRLDERAHVAEGIEEQREGDGDERAP